MRKAARKLRRQEQPSLQKAGFVRGPGIPAAEAPGHTPAHPARPHVLGEGGLGGGGSLGFPGSGAGTQPREEAASQATGPHEGSRAICAGWGPPSSPFGSVCRGDPPLRAPLTWTGSGLVTGTRVGPGLPMAGPQLLQWKGEGERGGRNPCTTRSKDAHCHPAPP